jgi:hypothetical protein
MRSNPIRICMCIFRVIGRYEIKSQVASTVAPRAIFSTNEDTNKCRQCYHKISLRRCALQRFRSLSINDIDFDYLWISRLPVARFCVKQAPSIIRRVIYVSISRRGVSARLITNRECFNERFPHADLINSKKSSRGSSRGVAEDVRSKSPRCIWRTLGHARRLFRARNIRSYRSRGPSVSSINRCQ